MSSLHVTRRRLLQTSFAAALLGRRQAAPGQLRSEPAQWLLLGTSTGKGIYRARWNSATGQIGTPELAVATAQPTFLTLHPHLPVLYCCNETDTAITSAISAFHLAPAAAELTPIATQLTHGSAPCFASVDRQGRFLLAANYGGGSLAAFPLSRTGQPGPAAAVFQCAGSGVCGTGGPVKDRQGAPHLHCATLSPDNRFVLACDLGDDAILAFALRPSSAGDPLGAPVRIQTVAGAGPRHLAFHPNGRWLYCINEINCTVSLYLWRPKGHIPAAQAVPDATLSVAPPGPSNANQPNTGAELAFSSDGRFLYTSTRFCDVLTIFSVDGSHGRLTQIQQLPCGGKTPRFFALDPSGRWLVCAHQDSNTLSVFARDSGTGRLNLLQTTPAPNPECIVWC